MALKWLNRNEDYGEPQPVTLWEPLCPDGEIGRLNWLVCVAAMEDPGAFVRVVVSHSDDQTSAGMSLGVSRLVYGSYVRNWNLLNGKMRDKGILAIPIQEMPPDIGMAD